MTPASFSQLPNLLRCRCRVPRDGLLHWGRVGDVEYCTKGKVKPDFLRGTEGFGVPNGN